MKRLILLAIAGVLLALTWGLLIMCRQNSKNGFVRVLHKNKTSIANYFALGVNSYYISGITASNVYLGNVTAPSHVLCVHYINEDTSHLKLRLPVDIELSNRTKLFISPPDFQLTERSTNSIVLGGLSDTAAFRRASLASRSDNIIILSSESYIARRYNSAFRQNRLERFVTSNADTAHASYLLKKSIDGVFCTDGLLVKDGVTGLLVYLYFYRNRFDVLNEDLGVVYVGTTIDTVNVPRFELTTLSADRVKTFASHPQRVNLSGSLYNGLLYLRSGLKADNESFFRLQVTTSVIDVYAIREGKYRYSFYLPGKFKGKTLDHFTVFENRLFALYGEFLVIHKLP